MPRVPYVGVNNTAKKVKKMYIGVGDKAHKVLKAYVGVNGIARIFYTADWWVPYGLSESNCIAAYQFYKAKNQGSANNDITGHGHGIYDYRNGTWDPDTGYYVSTKTSTAPSSLSADGTIDWATAVYWYTGLSDLSGSGRKTSKWFHAHANNKDTAARLGTVIYYWNGEYIDWDDYKNLPAFSLTYVGGNENNAGYLRGYRGNSALPTSGVVAFDRTKPQIYVNGNAIGCTYFNKSMQFSNNIPLATKGGYGDIGGGSSLNTYFRAAAFFNCGLSPRQHSDIAKAITEIK